MKNKFLYITNNCEDEKNIYRYITKNGSVLIETNTLQQLVIPTKMSITNELKSSFLVYPIRSL